MFVNIVGQASFQTTGRRGPSMMERSYRLVADGVVHPRLIAVERVRLGVDPEVAHHVHRLQEQEDGEGDADHESGRWPGPSCARRDDKRGEYRDSSKDDLGTQTRELVCPPVQHLMKHRRRRDEPRKGVHDEVVGKDRNRRDRSAHRES